MAVNVLGWLRVTVAHVAPVSRRTSPLENRREEGGKPSMGWLRLLVTGVKRVGNHRWDGLGCW